MLVYSWMALVVICQLIEESCLDLLQPNNSNPFLVLSINTGLFFDSNRDIDVREKVNQPLWALVTAMATEAGYG